jgi:glycosyltransferase involved in cell wall biosynthesis
MCVEDALPESSNKRDQIAHPPSRRRGDLEADKQGPARAESSSPIEPSIVYSEGEIKCDRPGRRWAFEGSVLSRSNTSRGRLKYRYLMPLYRLFGSAPSVDDVTPELRFGIDGELPESIQCGKGNLLFLSGWCYHSTQKIRRLSLLANGWAQQVSAWRLGRSDLFEAHCPEVDPLGYSYASGFWAFVDVRPNAEEDSVEVALKATLEDGSEVIEHLCSIRIEPNRASTAEDQKELPIGFAGRDRDGEPLVAICMATYNPPSELFSRQIESIRAQSYKNWVCVISDDHSDQESFETILKVVGSDRRFLISRASSRAGFYRNFERVLGLAPPHANFVALSDQDDFWHTDKLESLLSVFEAGITLAYADVNIVDVEGKPLSGTYWTTRPNNYTNFGSLILANTITGAASMFRRELLETILPFPEPFGHAYHDHWIACVAMAVGTVAYVDRSLHDYVQHSGNVIGHAAPPKRSLIRKIWGAAGRALRIRSTLGWWRGVYATELQRPKMIARVLSLRCGLEISGAKLRVLKRIGKLDESIGSALWMAARSLRGAFGVTETLGAEGYLLGAVIWKQSYMLKSWLKRTLGGIPTTPARRQKSDETEAAALTSVNQLEAPSVLEEALAEVNFIKRKTAPLSLEVSSGASTRVNLLIPEVNLKYFFGGYITKFNLARKIAQRGFNVRIVIVDECDINQATWRQQLSTFQGLENLLDVAEISYEYERCQPLEVSRDDVFIATTWWTGHIAHQAASRLGGREFLYLIQEYEPFTFPMGSLASLAAQSYTFPHYAVFSTDLLRDYFRTHGIGVFSNGEKNGETRSVWFNNAITDVGDITLEQIADRRPKRLLLYARPERHAARNMFEVAFLAIQGAIESGVFDTDWEFTGVGAVDAFGDVTLGRGKSLKVIARQSQCSYRDILRAHDLGLSLMYTPHPSLVPIEMASAGMVVVTNTYANKTAEKLIDISANLIPVEPTIDGVALGLRRAVSAVSDYEQRVKSSKVTWPSNWDESLDQRVTDRICDFIRAIQAGARRRHATSE